MQAYSALLDQEISQLKTQIKEKIEKNDQISVKQYRSTNWLKK